MDIGCDRLKRHIKSMMEEMQRFISERSVFEDSFRHQRLGSGMLGRVGVDGAVRVFAARRLDAIK